MRRGFNSRLSLLSGVRSILLRLIDYCQRVSSDSVWQLWSRSSSGGSSSSSPSALRQFVTRFDTPPSHACVRPRRFYLNKNRTHYSSQRRQLPSLPSATPSWDKMAVTYLFTAGRRPNLNFLRRCSAGRHTFNVRYHCGLRIVYVAFRCHGDLFCSRRVSWASN